MLEKILHMKDNLMVLAQNLAKILSLSLTYMMFLQLLRGQLPVHVSEADDLFALTIMPKVFLSD